MIPPPDIPANNKRSLSYFWMKDRLAIMLTRIIDSLCRRRNELEIVNRSLGTEHEEAVIQSHKLYLKEFPRLKNEMITNKLLSPLNTTNSEIEQLFTADKAKVDEENFKWFNVPYQFAEEYFYQRIHNFDKAGEHYNHFQNFDPFKLFKDETFTDFLKEASKLGDELIFKKQLDKLNLRPFSPLVRLSSDPVSTRVREQIYSFLLASICAENCDGGFFLNKLQVSYIDCEESFLPRPDSKGFHILVNKFSDLYAYLARVGASRKNLRIDFFLNYCGYDLFTTLCFAELLTNAMAPRCSIVFYTQPFPKFFLATADDIKDLLNYKSEDNYISSAISRFRQRFVHENTWRIVPLKEDGQIPTEAQDHDGARLCIIKGDYHYRRLLGGLRWNCGSTLGEAVQKGVYGNPDAIFTARAIKSDLIVDLKDGHSQMDYMVKMFTDHNNVNCLDINFVDLSMKDFSST